MVKKITTHEVDALSRIITQYKGDRGIERMIKSGAVQIQELENAAFPLFSRLSIDSMIGTQLDLIGDIVGQNRQGQDDITYRVFLKAKIGINTSSGTIEDVLSVWKILLPDATLELTELFPAEISLVTDAILTDAQKDFLKDFDDILSAGVRLSSVINYDPDNAFAFGEIHDEINDSGEVLPYDDIDKYGFDFNGATGVKAYTNPTLKSFDNFYYLDFKYRYGDDSPGVGTDGAVILSFNQSESQYQGLVLRTVKVGETHRLYYTFYFGDGSNSSTSAYSVINDGDTIQFATNIYSDASNTYMDVWLNGVNVQSFTLSLKSTYIEQFDLSRYDIGNDYPTGNSGSTYSILSNLTIWDSSKTTQEIEDLFDTFSSSDSVFHESFDGFTLGEVSPTGTEQYAVIGTTQTPDANEGEQYILTTSPLSQDDELYTCINDEWIQTSVSIGYEVSSLNDGLIYKYTDNGTYNVFEEHEEDENTGGFGDVNDLNVGGELATIL